MKNYAFVLFLFAFSMSGNDLLGQPSIFNMQFDSNSGVFEFDVIGQNFSGGEYIQIWIEGEPLVNKLLDVYANHHVSVPVFSLKTGNYYCTTFIECEVGGNGHSYDKNGCWVDIDGRVCIFGNGL